MGYGVLANAGARLYVPPYDPAITFEEANSKLSSNGKEWFGTAAFVHGKTGEGRRRTSGVTGEAFTAKTWDTVVDTMYRMYGVDPSNIQPGPFPWYANFAASKKDLCPLRADPKSGILANPSGGRLVSAWREMRSGTTNPSSETVSARDAISYSSAFWAVDPPFHRHWKFELEKHFMPQSKQYYFSDGGAVDISGITTLLQKRAEHVIAFDNDEGDETQKIWMYRTLFGQNRGRIGHHDSMIGGAENTQVFPQQYASAVIANLTNPKVMRAILHDVPVLRNDWLGIAPYTLKTLIIFSNMYSEEFVDSFTDKRIKPNLPKGFPTGFTFGTNHLEANMFCVLQPWKLAKYKEEISSVVHGRY